MRLAGLKNFKPFKINISYIYIYRNSQKRFTPKESIELVLGLISYIIYILQENSSARY